MGTNRIPREDLLEDLRRLADELGRTPRASDVAEHGKFGKNTYCRTFGTYTEACEEAGLNPNRHTDKHIPREDLLGELRRLGDELGRTPSMDDLRSQAEYSGTTYIRRFGSYPEACEAAGFEPNAYHQVTEDELLDDLRRLADELGRTPKASDVSELGKYSRTAYYNHFGGHRSACEEAGLEPNGRWYEKRREVEEAIGDVITGLDDPREV